MSRRRVVIPADETISGIRDGPDVFEMASVALIVNPSSPKIATLSQPMSALRFTPKSDRNSRHRGSRNDPDHRNIANESLDLSSLRSQGSLRPRACRAHKELQEFCHRHHGSNRVGNETILVGGMVHFIELFRTGFSVAAPCNLWE